MEIEYCDAIKGSNIGSLQKIFWKMLCKYYANIVQIFWKYCGNIVVQGKAAKILEVCRSFLELGIRSGAGFPGTGEEANYCALVSL